MKNDWQVWSPKPRVGRQVRQGNTQDRRGLATLFLEVLIVFSDESSPA